MTCTAINSAPTTAELLLHLSNGIKGKWKAIVRRLHIAILHYKRQALLFTRSTVQAIALSIRKGQNLKIWVGFRNLFEPFIAGTTWSQWVEILNYPSHNLRILKVPSNKTTTSTMFHRLLTSLE
jgi:hypothetical protein